MGAISHIDHVTMNNPWRYGRWQVIFHTRHPVGKPDPGGFEDIGLDVVASASGVCLLLKTTYATMAI